MLEGKKISELDPVTSISEGCCFPLLTKGATKRIAFGSLLSEIENRLPETGIEQVKEDVEQLKTRTGEADEKINRLIVDVENVKEDVSDVDEMVQGQNATIRNCVSTVETLEQTIEQTHFDDVLELEEAVRVNTNKVNAIDEKIPAQASAQNQLADKQFVQNAIPTFTDEQEAAINSGITEELVAKIPTGTVAQIDDNNVSTTTTFSSDKIKKGLSYSTEETLTGGTWIDGKPIYRKCGTINSVSAGRTVLDATLTTSYIDTVIDMRATAKTSDGSIVSFGNYVSSTIRSSLIVSPMGFEKLDASVAVTNLAYCVEYTKTTD